MVYLIICTYLFVVACCIGGLLFATHRALQKAGPADAGGPRPDAVRPSPVVSYDEMFRQIARRRMEPANSGRRS